MNSSIVIVKNIWAEDLFKWFYENIAESAGDGSGLIVCKNYKETALWFQEWFNYEFPGKYLHPIDEYDDICIFHDNNENYMFSSTQFDMYHRDYTFIVEEDCIFAFKKRKCIIKAIK